MRITCMRYMVGQTLSETARVNKMKTTHGVPQSTFQNTPLQVLFLLLLIAQLASVTGASPGNSSKSNREVSGGSPSLAKKLLSAAGNSSVEDEFYDFVNFTGKFIGEKIIPYLSRKRISLPRKGISPPDDDIGKIIRLVGEYIAAHKKDEFDQRYYDEHSKPPPEKPYMKKFPTPKLKYLYPDVRKACEGGFMYCVKEIFSKAKRSIVYKRHHTVGDKIGEFFKEKFLGQTDEDAAFRPFGTPLLQFQYRTTAQYYMCWYTLHHQAELRHFGKSCPIGGSTSHYLSNDQVPFGCAFLSFCPDPCCGGYHGFPRREADCHKYNQNPCRFVPRGKCLLKPSTNRNLKDLMTNRFNISCDCQAYRKGFVWSSRFKMCVDKDECYDGDSSCGDTEFCRNAVGSYVCLCRRGYVKDAASNKCVRDHQIDIGPIWEDSADNITLYEGTTPGPDLLTRMETKSAEIVKKIFDFFGMNGL